MRGWSILPSAWVKADTRRYCTDLGRQEFAALQHGQRIVKTRLSHPGNRAWASIVDMRKDQQGGYSPPLAALSSPPIVIFFFSLVIVRNIQDCLWRSGIGRIIWGILFRIGHA